MGKRALENIRVLSLGSIWMVPHITVQMVAMGAEVIRIENISYFDFVRGLVNPPQPGWDTYPGGAPGPRPYNRNNYYNDTNWGVQEITLDLTNPKGRDIFFKYLKISDIVMENFRYGVMEHDFNLGYEVLKEVKPDIIFLSAPGYGNVGPEKEYVAFGANQWHSMGMANITGYPDSGPMQAPINYGDPTASSHCTGTILAALLYRNKTGKGQYIDVSQTEPGVGVIGEIMLDYTMNGRLPARTGNRHPYHAPHGCYRCMDEEQLLAISVGTEEEWQALCQAMGKPELASDPRFARLELRWENRKQLDAIIESWTSSLPRYEAMLPLRRAKVRAFVPGGFMDIQRPYQRLLAPHNYYRCKPLDRWVTIACTNEQEWRALCHAMGKPELITEPRFANSLVRWNNQDQLDNIIAEWTNYQESYSVMHALQPAGVPSAPVLTVADVIHEPHHRTRHYYKLQPHTESLTVFGPCHAWLMSKTPRVLERASPCLGEHNEYFYGELLGMTKDEMAQLEREQIIGKDALPSADGTVPRQKKG